MFSQAFSNSFSALVLIPPTQTTNDSYNEFVQGVHFWYDAFSPDDLSIADLCGYLIYFTGVRHEGTSEGKILAGKIPSPLISHLARR